jgi:hypothetical protein
MGATACVGEIPTGILRYSNQWEILGLHAPRPLLCLAATRDAPVFLPQHAHRTLDKTAEHIYKLYGAESSVQLVEFDSVHAYNRPMRERFYAHVAEHLLGMPGQTIAEPEDVPVEPAEQLRCGLPSASETMQSLTYRRARELVAAHHLPPDVATWEAIKQKMLATLSDDILGGFPPRDAARPSRVRTISWKGRDVEHWIVEPEPGVLVPVAITRPRAAPETTRFPALIVVDELGKQHAFSCGVVERLIEAGNLVVAIDVRGTGETAGTVPAIEYGPAMPDYNLSNYSLFVGRPLMGMQVHDVRSIVDFVAQRPDVDTARIALVGRGRGAMVALLVAGFDNRIQRVAVEEMLSTWVFPDEFVDIGLSYFIPRILTVGDIEHLAACVAPRPLLILNPVDGRR